MEEEQLFKKMGGNVLARPLNLTELGDLRKKTFNHKLKKFSIYRWNLKNDRKNKKIDN